MGRLLVLWPRNLKFSYDFILLGPWVTHLHLQNFERRILFLRVFLCSFHFNLRESGRTYDEPFLVLASDGLWDVLSNDQVASITRKVSATRLQGVETPSPMFSFRMMVFFAIKMC